MTTYYPSRPAPTRHVAPARRPAPPPPAPPRAQPERRFRPDIEGLRAVAVLLVVADHAGVAGITGGYVGVDVFFVISGFLITLHLFRELRDTGRIRFGAFYGRRMVRLLPASTAVLVTTVVAAWAWMSPIPARAVSVDALTAAAYGINIRLAAQGTDYLSAEREPSPLQHFWSLAVEEQFYFIWPLLLVVASAAWLRRGRPSRWSAGIALAGLGAVSFAVCVWQTQHAQPWAYFGIQSRAWELAAGALVALAADTLARLPVALAGVATWAGLGMIGVSAFRFDQTTLFPGKAALLPVAGATLVIAGGCARHAFGAGLLLRTGVFQWFGKLSYSWYLWHWPVLILAPHVAGRELNVWVTVAVAAFALLPAWLSLRLVENRIRFHRVFRRRPRRGLVLGATLTALTVGACALLLGLPTRVRGEGTGKDTAALVSDAQQAAEARRQLLDLIRAGSSLGAMPQNLVPPVTAAGKDFPQADKGCLASLDDTSTAAALALGCDRHGEPGAPTTVVLFGDSHTEQWFDAMDAAAKRRHWRLVVLTKSGCTPADALTIKINARRAYTECATWREDAFAVIARLKPAFVVLSTRTYADPPVDRQGAPTTDKAGADAAWASATVASATRLAQLGTRPVVMQDTPDPHGTSVPDCVAAHPAAVQQCALKVPTAIYAGRRTAIAAAAQQAGVTVVDPTEWFCTEKVCPAIVGNALVYRDGSHVTSSYVKLLAPLLTAALPT